MLNQKDHAAVVARQELLSPTIVVVEQVLAVHKPILEKDMPVIARIDDTHTPESFYIYFFDV